MQEKSKKRGFAAVSLIVPSITCQILDIGIIILRKIKDLSPVMGHGTERTGMGLIWL